VPLIFLTLLAAEIVFLPSSSRDAVRERRASSRVHSVSREALNSSNTFSDFFLPNSSSSLYGEREHEREEEAARESPAAASSRDGIDQRAACLEMRNVTMRYRLHKPEVLSRLSLSIKAGQKVAICGRTGCGKSTLFSVLSRLYPVGSGAVEIDGVDIYQSRLTVLRRELRVVTQDAWLVGDTLRESISGTAGGGRAVEDGHVWEALRMVSMDAQVRALPSKLDSPITAGEDALGEIVRIELSCLPQSPYFFQCRWWNF
jgi:ABC-type multidrug transport system fused ATPase/permease subunit